jgi:glycine dehydrogenase subunit 1
VDWYLGAGIYERFIPSTVAAVISRGEFLTAYTPYQPELSQGYLQTIYEFQTMIAEIYGMEIANASMYDGATACAEAAILSTGLKNRTKIVTSDTLHPHYLSVLKTYAWANSLEVVTLTSSDTVTQWSGKLDSETSCLIVQSPNFFGSIESLAEARAEADRVGALLVVVADPVSCALMKPPGEYGADIVVGEGQPMGIAMGFGGPVVGLFTCKADLVRRIPGRIVGRTHDRNGTPGYVMTLRTREQDIRREKATSNICTNEALMALASTVYMTALGKNGLKSVAESSVRNAQYLMSALTSAGFTILNKNQKVFNEFVVDIGTDADAVLNKLLSADIMAGLALGTYDQKLKNCLLVAVTETKTCKHLDRFVAELSKAVKS